MVIWMEVGRKRFWECGSYTSSSSTTMQNTRRTFLCLHHSDIGEKEDGREQGKVDCLEALARQHLLLA